MECGGQYLALRGCKEQDSFLHIYHEGMRSGGAVPLILKLGTRWGDCSASRLSRFTPRVRNPGAHCIGGRRASLDALEKIQTSCLYRESMGRAARCIVTVPTALCTFVELRGG